MQMGGGAAGEDSGSNSSDESSDSDVKVGDYEAGGGWGVLEKCQFKPQTELIGIHFAYKWSTGWDRGRVIGIEKKQDSPDF